MASRRRSTRSVRQSFDGGAHQMALVFFQLGFEALEQGKGVGRGTGKAGQHLVLIEPADLARGRLDDDAAQGDLAVAAQRDLIAAADGKNSGAVILIHAVQGCCAGDGKFKSKKQTRPVLPEPGWPAGVCPWHGTAR
jgi:hypothetical protein